MAMSAVVDSLLRCLGVFGLGAYDEYESPTRLDGNSGAYFRIPTGIILDGAVGDKLVTAFSFFSVSSGLDCKSMFSVNWVVEWSGRRPNRHSGGINDRFASAIAHLGTSGYVTLDGDVSNSRRCTALFDKGLVSDACNRDGFAMVWVDELYKILGWVNPNGKDVSLNCDVLLRVFAYLRKSIYRRNNRLRPEERNVDDRNDHAYDVERRRARSPEVCERYYRDMADELGMSARAVSRAVDALCGLGLIHSEPLPRVVVGGKWRTSRTLFCNTYKREGQYLLASGREYYEAEIANKRRLAGVSVE